MKDKQEIYWVNDDQINGGANQIVESQVIEADRKVLLKRFGGCDPRVNGQNDAIIAVQWGSGPNWETIRVISGGSMEFTINREFIGNGAKKFRVVRINNGTIAKRIAAWVEALIYESK